MNDKQKLILNRKHATIKNREAINSLVYDSYKGGFHYTSQNHLHQHSLESDFDYNKRAERSIFISHTRTLIDILIGFIFDTEIKRNIPEKIDYIKTNATPTQSLSSFIQKTATLSSLFTCAVLVDSPTFNSEDVKSIKDREDKGLNPYCKRYTVFNIQDFSLDEMGKLNWILFNDNYLNTTDPFQENIEVICRTLWTKTECTKFYYKKSNKGEIEFDYEEIIPHNLKEVPVILTSFRDIEDDKFNDSFSENLALLDRSVYNYLSLLDVCLSKNAIKPLMYPSKSGEVPESLKDASQLSKLTVIPYPQDTTNKPFYLEATNTDIQSYLETIQMLLEFAKESIGLSKSEKIAVSGKAKQVELRKLQVILKQGAQNLQDLENEILRLVCKWESKDLDYKIEYPSEFDSDDTEQLLTRLYDLLTIDSETLRTEAIKQITTISLPDIERDKIELIINEVNSSESFNLEDPELDNDNNNDEDIKPQSISSKTEK